ncbi:MAG: 4Fe-4S binding protein [Candidatus Ratteibacteria bacterium]|jgi:2-oxoglutarate ferredoxin oxidoreductase subunit delta
MKTNAKTKFKVIIDNNYCKGCGLCVHFCPKKGLKISDNKNKKGSLFVEFSGNECTGCLRCALICPDAALKIIKIGG